MDSIKQGQIDSAEISQPNFIDEIIVKMKSLGVADELSHIVEDKRRQNAVISLEFVWMLGIAAKMKIHTSLTDISHAIMDAEVLSELGYALWNTERSLEKGLMGEGTIRHLLGQYERDDLITGYNRCVQERILSKLNLSATIHILDRTKLCVELTNDNYEESTVVREDGGAERGYKPSTLRGITGDSEVIEDIRLGTMKTHDLELSRDMILNSTMLKPKDMLINDRRFSSHAVLNGLKIRREVDTYVPLRKNMCAYQEAVSIATRQAEWKAHPNKKRESQKLAFVTDLGPMWRSEKPEDDVPLNARVFWDTKNDEYYVFVTTDTEKSAKQIIQIYELHPEIEENYRQVKDFWCL